MARRTVALAFVLFAALAVAQYDDEEDDVAPASGAGPKFQGGPPVDDEAARQQREQQEAFIKHLLQVVTPPCREEITALISLSPEQQQGKVRYAGLQVLGRAVLASRRSDRGAASHC